MNTTLVAQEDSFGRLLWRILTGLMILLGFVFALLDIARPFDPGTIGVNPTHAPFSLHDPLTVEISEPPPKDSALAKAHVCLGSRLVLSQALSYFALQNIRAGDTVEARVEAPPLASLRQHCDHTTNNMDQAFIAQKAAASRFDYMWAIVRVVSLCVALVLIVRRPTHLGALSLAGFLAGLGLLCNWSPYPQNFAEVGYFSRSFATAVALPQFIVFAASFAVPNLKLVRLGWTLFWFFVAALAVAVSIEDALYWHSQENAAVETTLLVVILGGFFAGIALIRYQTLGASGDTLQRLYWVSGTLIVSLSGGLVYLVLDGYHLLGGGLENVALTTSLLPLGWS
jgi:hypothetical protein